MITEKKYQHFVPKFYLRFFSDNRKSVGAYILKNDKYIKNASLNSIGGANYLYGKDGVIENLFSDLEGKWNKLISKIINSESLELSLSEYFMLLTFIFFSDARSKEVADSQNEMINYIANLTNKLVNNDKNGNIDFKEDMAKFNIPNYYPLSVFEEIVPLLFDLKLCLLKNNTSTEFITSDCIVVKYNQYLLDKNFYFGYGYGAVGFQCFIPISPTLCLYLFDSTIYEHKLKNNTISLNANEFIFKLNKLFVYNSDKCLFFHNSFSEEKIKIILKNNKKKEKKNNRLFKSDDNKYMILVSQKCVNKNFHLTFVKIKNEYKNKKLNIKTLQAPIRKLPSQIINKNDNTPKEVIQELNGKVFHLER